MGDPVQRAEHIKDAVEFFADVDRGHLPAVSYLKPDSFDDGHPATSKLDILEALVDRVVAHIKARPDLFEETAIFVTFDERGGYWDSGFFQPIDFLATDPASRLSWFHPIPAVAGWCTAMAIMRQC